MPQTKTRPATYADIEALPENMVGEIIFGVLHAHPRPTPRHGVASGGLQTELTFPFDYGRGGPGGWIFIVEPELHLGPSCRRAGYRRMAARAADAVPRDGVHRYAAGLAVRGSFAFDTADRPHRQACGLCDGWCRLLLVCRPDRQNAGSAGADWWQVAAGGDIQGCRSGQRAALRVTHLSARRALGAGRKSAETKQADNVRETPREYPCTTICSPMSRPICGSAASGGNPPTASAST